MANSQTVVAHITDFHYGKKTRTYNKDVAKEKFAKFSKDLVDIRKQNKDADKLVLVWGGDIVDGTGIYPSQPHHQDASDVTEQIDDCTDLTKELFKEQLAAWGAVDNYTVPGNHGRTHKANHEGSNYDRILYSAIRREAEKLTGVRVLEDDRNVGPFLKPFRVRNHRMLAYHGHSIQMYTNIPWYGIIQRLCKWKADKFAGVSTLMLGHFHGFGLWNVQGCNILLGGTTVTDDMWALESFGSGAVNKWWVFGVTDKNPMQWSIPLNV